MEDIDIADIFKLRLAALRSVDADYYRDNRDEMIASAKMAQELIATGKPVTDEVLDDIHKKYGIDRGGDVSPTLVAELVDSYKKDVLHGIIDEKGKIIGKCSQSEVLHVAHALSDKGIPAKAGKLLEEVDKNKPQPVAKHYHNDKMLPVFEVRMQALQEADLKYFNEHKEQMELSIAAAQKMIEQNLPLQPLMVRNVCQRMNIDAGGDVNPLEIIDLVNAYKKDLKQGYIDESGRLIAKCSKSNIMDVQHAFSPKPNAAKTFLKTVDEKISGNRIINQFKYLQSKIFKKNNGME